MENTQEQIQNLQNQIDELRSVVNKNNFSNLYVFDTPVQFRREIDFTRALAGTKLIYIPANATDPTEGGGAATGRIPVDVGGTTKYLAYY